MRDGGGGGDGEDGSGGRGGDGEGGGDDEGGDGAGGGGGNGGDSESGPGGRVAGRALRVRLSARSWHSSGLIASTASCDVIDRHCRRSGPSSGLTRRPRVVCHSAVRCCAHNAGKHCTISIHSRLESTASPLSARS